MVIELYPCELSKQKPTQVKYHYLVLEEDYIEYVLDMIADEPDPMDEDGLVLPWISTRFVVAKFAKKSTVMGIYLGMNHVSKVWQLEIVLNAFPQEVTIMFKKRKDADELYNKIAHWLVPQRLTQTEE